MNRHLRAFLRGAASVLDLGGLLAPEYPVCLTAEEAWAADAAALRGDWEAVAGDLRRAMEQARREQEP